MVNSQWVNVLSVVVNHLSTCHCFWSYYVVFIWTDSSDLNAWSRIFEKLIISLLVSEFSYFMEPEDSLHCFQSLPLDSVLSEMNSFHVQFPTCCRLPFSGCVSQLVFPFRFCDRHFYAFLIPPMRTMCTIHLSILDFTSLIIFGETYKLWSSTLYNFLHPPL